jgi:leader peptidase (prepilin peptidase)/N-methyltransferase
MIPIVVLLLVAPVIGSFLGAMAVRIPEGRPVVLARSQCEACGRVLAPAELIPIVSFLWLGGRCRHCGGAIGALPLVTELTAVAIVAWAALLTSGPILFASCVYGWSLLLLAAIDWRVQLLPDVVTLPLMVAGLISAIVLPLEPWRDHAIGAVAGFTVLATTAYLYRLLRNREGLGLGDAKLMAAIGAWVGWQRLPSVLLFASMLGLLFAVAMSLRGRRLSLSDGLPFGTFLAAGGWLVWLHGPLVGGWLAAWLSV